MSGTSLHVAAVIFITIVAIEYGGMSLLWYIRRRSPEYMDNPVRRALFTAGHAHAGVLVLLALIGMLYVDHADLSGSVKTLVRWGLFSAPILIPAGFFLSIASPKSTRPGKLLTLVYLGAAALACSVVVLGVGLLRAV